MAKVTDIIKDGRKTFFSIEITPPDRGRSINDIFSTTDQLIPYDPQFINVTYHQPYIDYTEDNGAVKRIHRSKKPGTVGVCAAIQNKYKVDAVPHLICGGHDKYETEDALIDLYYLGIENVFVVRGDTTPGYKKFIPERYGNVYAADLVDQISCLNKGKYIDELDDPINTNFCIGVAGYPEKHCEALNFDRDMLYLKEKVDKGADYIITQMSFDLIALKKFADKAKNLGINVPIIPGIKPVTSLSQIEMLPRTFNISIPMELINAIECSKTKKEEFASGIKYTAKLVQNLLDFGFPGIHLFTKGKGTAAKALLDAVFGGKVC